MIAVLLLLFIPAGLMAQDLAKAARQILDANCVSCHGAALAGGLDLRSRESALKGGGRGAAIRPGDASQSLLLHAVMRDTKLQMPPGKAALSAADVDTLRRWIDAGAAWGDASSNVEPAWWSFKKVRPVSVPGPQGKNPVDAFVDEKLQKLGLQPVGRADARTLIRRAYLDLHGLPPSPEEVDAFLDDKSADAWPKLIDKLLASPRYGERWGRHWLDVVRYADTGGFETDIYFPNAWRYRDYVIKSFNDDKPYNRFVQEQIAGDEMWPGNLDLAGGFDIPKENLRKLEARIGTGMYTIGPVYHEAAFQGEQVRYEWLTDVVDTTGEAFLGVTLGCSRCHDHKFDPLTKRDYHAMMAIFAASEEREVPVISQFNIFGFKSGYPNWLRVEELKGAVQRIDRDARKRAVDKVRARFGKDVLDAYAVRPKERTAEQLALAAKLEGALTEAGLQENAQGKNADISYTADETKERERLINELGKAALSANPVMQTATILSKADVIPDVHLTSRGDWRSKGEVVAPAFPAVLAGKNDVRDSLRRKALAEWLTSGEHPLTARVAVNRVWHWHFGRGIVATPNDFGRQGEEPSHPQLLDWLAADFMKNGWSMKKLHRLIMTSDVYQRASTVSETNSRIDAQNRYLWRMNRQRLDAETLRDSVLAAAGTINLKMGGRPVIPPLTAEEYSSLWSRNQWPESLDPREHTRRSVYLYVKRTFPHPMLSAFDTPDTSMSCSRRDSTTVAPQALTMINSKFMWDQAKALVTKVNTAAADGDRIRGAFRLVLQREPNDSELRKASSFVKQEQDGWVRFALVLLNTNEFLYMD